MTAPFVCRNVFFRLMLLFCLVILCFSAEAQKVISLSPAVTETIYHLGKGNSLVGRSSACNYPEEVKKLPVAGDFARPDTAKILALKPDIVITNDLIVPAAAETFRRSGIKFLFLPCRNVKEYRKMVEILGKELGAQESAKKEIKRTNLMLESFRKQKKNDMRVLCLVWHQPVIVAGEDTILTELVTLAGLENCTFNGVKGYFKATSKYLLRCEADAVIVFSAPENYRKHPVLKHLKAIQNGRIFYFENSDIFQRPGPRFFTGVEKLREALSK